MTIRIPTRCASLPNPIVMRRESRRKRQYGEPETNSTFLQVSPCLSSTPAISHRQIQDDKSLAIESLVLERGSPHLLCRHDKHRFHQDENTCLSQNEAPAVMGAPWKRPEALSACLHGNSWEEKHLPRALLARQVVVIEGAGCHQRPFFRPFYPSNSHRTSFSYTRLGVIRSNNTRSISIFKYLSNTNKAAWEAALLVYKNMRKAGDEIRTRDSLLGRQSYTRNLPKSSESALQADRLAH